VEFIDGHTRPGFRPLYLSTDHPDLRKACDYARQQVKASDPSDLLRAQVMDGSPAAMPNPAKLKVHVGCSPIAYS
jgi:hypothetical protein